jgi:methylthioribose-1-phosphate isomerase
MILDRIYRFATGHTKMKSIPLDMAASADNAIVWCNDRLYLLDQRVLPAEESYLELLTAEDTADAIRDMVVRGAPAIGVTAAFGVVLAARNCFTASPASWKEDIAKPLAILEASRPTAINLFWALERMKGVIATLGSEDPEPLLLKEAQAIHKEDIAANHHLGDLGAALIEHKTSVITHCNAGALATGGYGTALGVIRSAWAAGKIEMAYADETRPWMQGARLTAWELYKDNIPVTLLVDGAAASLMASGDVGWVIVGSDRIAANGDVANKIGTYSLALAAKYHGVKVMVAAPSSTVDMAVASGAEIPIESRDPAEILCCGGQQVAAAGVAAWNPVFDITPAALVNAIVTERGVVMSPDREKMEKMMA